MASHDTPRGSCAVPRNVMPHTVKNVLESLLADDDLPLWCMIAKRRFGTDPVIREGPPAEPASSAQKRAPPIDACDGTASKRAKTSPLFQRCTPATKDAAKTSPPTTKTSFAFVSAFSRCTPATKDAEKTGHEFFRFCKFHCMKCHRDVRRGIWLRSQKYNTPHKYQAIWDTRCLQCRARLSAYAI